MAQRYPTDQNLPRLTFLMADSYRKSALLIDTNATTMEAQQAAESLNAKRAASARRTTCSTRCLISTPPRIRRPNADKMYQKLTYFSTGADCLYDLGKYEDAIKLYQQAAFRYQDDPAALSAYVQIVNSYCALGRLDDARTANERAKWILRRMPPEAFQEGEYSMPKKYWDDWLKWTSDARVF